MVLSSCTSNVMLRWDFCSQENACSRSLLMLPHVCHCLTLHKALYSEARTSPQKMSRQRFPAMLFNASVLVLFLI